MFLQLGHTNGLEDENSFFVGGFGLFLKALAALYSGKVTNVDCREERSKSTWNWLDG